MEEGITTRSASNQTSLAFHPGKVGSEVGGKSFFAVTVHLLRSGVVPMSAGGRRIADRLMAWVPLMTILGYGIVVLMAQLRLDAIPNILQTIFG